MSVSVDGFVSGPNGEKDWVFKTGTPESKAWLVAQTAEAGLIIMGRKSFETMAPYWPTSTDPFAAPMNAIPKAVFTKKGFKPAAIPMAIGNWAEAQVFDDDLAGDISELKAGQGKPILAIGGAEFIRNLIATGLVDEFLLVTHPVVLGAGLPIFDGLATAHYLKLIDVKVFPGGTVAHSYGVKDLKGSDM